MFYDHENEYYSIRKGYVIPQDPKMFADLQSIDRECMREVRQMYGFGETRDWLMNTIANTTFEAILQKMALQFTTAAILDRAQFNFYNLFGIIISNRIVENADKEGNLNVQFIPGEDAIAMISLEERPPVPTGLKPADVFTLVDEDGNPTPANKEYYDIDLFARYSLSKKYQIVIPEELSYGCFAVLHHFTKCIFEHMLYELGGNPDLKLATVNFNDNIEFHARRKRDGIAFSMRPGMNAKLIVKNDDQTEEREDLDED